MKKTKKWAMVLAVVLAAMMLFSVLFSVFYNANAATALDSLKDKQKSIAADKKRIADKLTEAKKDKQSIINQKFALDDQIAITEQEIENTTLLIQEYKLEIAKKQQEYMDAVAAENEKQEKYRLRLRAMEEAGDVSYISILMQSRSFSDLLGRVSIMSEIADNDQKTIDELRFAREKIAEIQLQLETEKDEQLISRRQLSDAQEELAQQYRELDSMMATIESDINELTIADKKADEMMDELQKQIQKIIEESKKKNTVYVGGDFLWPCPDYIRISSHFGTREHPILKKTKKHTGVDLACTSGKPIYAANSGTVILSTYNGGYGNCVVIDHGGGVVTLYAHCSKLLVKKGQNVKKGDKIALVGSTGMSTGPHLHFEIIKNGVQENPMNYFKQA